MTRKIIDCRAVPNDMGCTLAGAIGTQRAVRWSLLGADRHGRRASARFSITLKIDPKIAVAIG